MRLISNHKDYYDGVQALGHDDTLMYRRIAETLSLANHMGDVEGKAIESLVLAHAPDCPIRNDKQRWERVVVGVCGKLYLGIRHKVYIDGTYPAKYETKYYYDKEQLRKSFPGLETVPAGWYTRWDGVYTPYPSLGLYNDNCDDIFVRLGVPIFIIDSVALLGKNQWGHDSIDGALIKNPLLKSYEFYKVLPDYDIYQELEMYLGNVLVTRDEIPVMSDKQKVASHGFDSKYGFRTRKKTLS